MNTDYLFVGISRGNRNDYKELYRLTKAEVYAVAISYVKDKNLATEVLAETFKRVWMYAYSYNTDMDGERWILEIARNLSMNALLDKNIAANSEKCLQDNLSKVIIDTISNLSGDRGKILLLSSVTGLSVKNLADFFWYSPSGIKKEQKNAIKELEKLNEDFYKELDVPATLRDNLPDCVPDVWNIINDDRQTILAYTSHEVLDISEDDYIFGVEKSAPECGMENALETVKKKNKSSKIIAIVAAAVLVAAAGIITAVILKDKTTEGPSSEPYEYYGSPQYNTKITVYEANGKIYYRNLEDGDNLYSVEFSESGRGTVSKLNGISSKDFTVTENNIFYRSLEDGYIYKADIQGGNSVKFSDIPASNLSLYGDKIYFSGSDGIYSLSLEGGESELVYDCSTDSDLERYDIEITNDGTLFFSAGAWKGIHYLTEYKGQTSIDTVFIDEAYTLQSDGERLYFTYQGLEELYIYYYELSDIESKNFRMVNNIHPGTGAFYARNGYIYYEGYTAAKDGMKDLGIYRISEKDNSVPELLFSYDVSGGMYISDLYVSDGEIFCFYSTGEKNGSTKFEARSLSDPGKVLCTLFG